MTLGRCPLSIFCSRGTPPSEVRKSVEQSNVYHQLNKAYHQLNKAAYHQLNESIINLMKLAFRAGGSAGVRGGVALVNLIT